MRKIARCVAIAAAMLVPIGLHANVIQYFGFQTENPANLMFVKSNELRIGGSGVLPYLKQKGTVAGVDSIAWSHHPYEFAFPEFRLAHRCSKKVVYALDICEPSWGLYPFKKDAFTAPAGTGMNLDSVSIVPKISFALNDCITLGASFAATYVQFSFRGMLSDFSFFESFSYGWAYSYQLGITYKINDKSFFDFTYISKIETSLHGRSFACTEYSDELKVKDFIWVPDTFIARYTRFMSQKWLAVLEVSFSEWGDQHDLVLDNTVPTGLGPPDANRITIPIDWKNTWRFFLFNRYQMCEKFAPFLGLTYETSCITRSNNNYVGLPINNLVVVFLGGDYMLTDSVKVTALIGDAFWPELANNKAPGYLNPSVKSNASWYFIGGNVTVYF